MELLNCDTPVGFEITGSLKTITQERVYSFSGGFPRTDDWPNKNIHTDSEFAKNCGLSDRAASGAMFEGYLIELMIDCFGELWLKTGKLDLKFIHVVTPGDTLFPKAIVQSKMAQGATFKLVMDIWCENQHGEQVVIGTASGIINS